MGFSKEHWAKMELSILGHFLATVLLFSATCMASEDPFFPIEGKNQYVYKVTSKSSYPVLSSEFLETISGIRVFIGDQFERTVSAIGIQELHFQGEIYPTDISRTVTDTCQMQRPFGCSGGPVFRGDSIRFFTYQGEDYMFEANWDGNIISGSYCERIFRRGIGKIFEKWQTLSTNNTSRSRKVLVSQNEIPFDSSLAQRLYDYVGALPAIEVGIHPKGPKTSAKDELFRGAWFDANGRKNIGYPNPLRKHSFQRIRVGQ